MLYIVSTPIGNLEDISLRALRIIKEADVIISEDTRHTGLLLKHYQIPHKPMISLYDDVEFNKLSQLTDLCTSDQKIVLVSDAGTPLISDPGYKLVRNLVKNNIKIDHIPGPTSAISALVLSGLPPDKFIFWGFPVKNKINEDEGTNIYFVSPHKLLRFLALLDEEKEIVICRELTKLHQEVWHGKVKEALVKFAKVKGEIVVLWHN